MSLFKRLFGDRRDRQIEDIFERIRSFLESDDEQNARMPEEIRDLVLRGQDVDMLPDGVGEFGRSLTNPVPVNGPIGEVIYLSSLKTTDGRRVFSHRFGSVGFVDVFELVSEDGKLWDLLYLSMYHARKSRLAPQGYTLWTPTGILATTKTVRPFPLNLPDEVSTWSRATLGFPLAGAGMRASIESGVFLRPPKHEALLETVYVHGKLTTEPKIMGLKLRTFVDKVTSDLTAVFQSEPDIAEIDATELAFFCSSMATLSYSVFGANGRDHKMLDEFTSALVADSVKRDRTFSKQLSCYRQRYTQYSTLLTSVIDAPTEQKRDKLVAVMLHLFECATGQSAQGYMIRFVIPKCTVIAALFQDCIDFARTR